MATNKGGAKSKTAKSTALGLKKKPMAAGKTKTRAASTNS